jgi:hypothetical protein
MFDKQEFSLLDFEISAIYESNDWFGSVDIEEWEV